MSKNKPYISIFKKENVNNWTAIKLNIIDYLQNKIDIANANNNDFIVEIKDYDARSGKQLRGYWKLISNLQGWLLEQGNLYLQEEEQIFNVNIIEQLSDWVKIQAGHCTREKVSVAHVLCGDLKSLGNILRYIYIPKSIKIKEGCTKQDMIKILNWMENFGIDQNIVDANGENFLKLKTKDYDNILRDYND